MADPNTVPTVSFNNGTPGTNTPASASFNNTAASVNTPDTAGAFTATGADNNRLIDLEIAIDELIGATIKQYAADGTLEGTRTVTDNGAADDEGDVAITVSSAWPQVQGNAAGYTFEIHLASGLAYQIEDLPGTIASTTGTFQFVHAIPTDDSASPNTV